MTTAKAPAKLNLALVVGPLRPDGKHEVATVMQKLALHDVVGLEPAAELNVSGFPGDTLVREALRALGRAAGVPPAWHVRIEKRIPVAAGLGGGSSDAAAALRLANAVLPSPLSPDALHELAAVLGADVPFFLRDGPVLASGDGTVLETVALPVDYTVLLVLPHRSRKESTASVYAAFDARSGQGGFGERRSVLRDALTRVRHVRDLASLPRNDLTSSPLADDLVAHGAFRADVTGAGPVVFGLFETDDEARRAAAALGGVGETWLTRPLASG